MCIETATGPAPDTEHCENTAPAVAIALAGAGRHAVKTIADTLGVASRWTTPIAAGALTGSRSAAIMARRCGLPLRSTAATARRSPGWRRTVASTAPIFAT